MSQSPNNRMNKANTPAQLSEAAAPRQHEAQPIPAIVLNDGAEPAIPPTATIINYSAIQIGNLTIGSAAPSVLPVVAPSARPVVAPIDADEAARILLSMSMSPRENVENPVGAQESAASTLPSNKKRKLKAGEDSGAITPAPKKQKLANRSRKKESAEKEKEIFSLPTPEEGVSPKLGKPDESKFTVTLRHENGPQKGQLKTWTYKEKRRKHFNWNDRKHIQQASCWRSQIIKRAKISRRINPRPRWTEEEVEALRAIVARHMANIWHRRDLNWGQIAAEFNNEMRGGVAYAGELYAQTTTSAPRPNSFSIPEEDVTMIEEETSEPWVKEPKKKRKALINTGRNRQTNIVDKDYEYGERGTSAIKTHAFKLPSVTAAMDEGSGSEDSDDSSDSPDASDYGDPVENNLENDTYALEDVDTYGFDNSFEDNYNSVEDNFNSLEDSYTFGFEEALDDDDTLEDDNDHEEGASSMPSFGTGIVRDPENYEVEGFVQDPRVAALQGPRAIAKDKAGPNWMRGG